MQAISKPASRRRAAPAAALAFVRQLGSLRVLGRGSRHLGRAGRIRARFIERRTGLGWDSGWKVLARPPRTSIMLRESIVQLQPVSRSRASEPSLGKNRQRPCASVQNITHLHITAGNAMGVHPASRAYETQSRRDFRAAASFAATVESRSAAAGPYFAPSSRIVAGSARFFPAPSEHPTRTLVPALSGKRARVQPWLATSVIEDGSVATDMPARMVRKHRRLEHQAWPHPEDSVVPSQAWPVAANARKIHETQWRQPAIDDEVPTRSPQMRTVTHAQADPVINVARITDEVIKQIDRRFIAARERRGKI